ncbi:MAG: adenylate kinase [Acidimicrobiales bacterium]|nr:adenylate kinase [Acidimicrobiales bacterium]
MTTHPERWQAIAVVGSSGSGKTSLARRLSSTLNLSHIELDALYHLPDWRHRTAEEFRAEIQRAVTSTENGWVMCGGYDTVAGPLRDAHADTIIWLDLPRRTVLRRIVLRTVRRGITREELWNGNRESILGLLRPDPDKNVALRAMLSFASKRARYASNIRTGVWAGKQVVILRSPSEVKRFVAGIRA